MKTINNIIKKIDLNAHVDYDTARCLMLMGMPQGKAVLVGVTSSGENHYEYQKIGQPFYVTIYKTNTVRKLVSLNKGHDRDADAMCYAPTMNEAWRWIEDMLCNN